MKSRGFLLLSIMFIAMNSIPCVIHAEETENIKNAKEFFEKFKEMENNYDTEIAELYDDTAKIDEYGASDYKMIIKLSYVKAKEHKEYYRYADTTYSEEGDKVLIESRRTSGVRNFETKNTILIGKDNKGNWKIYKQTDVLK